MASTAEWREQRKESMNLKRAIEIAQSEKQQIVGEKSEQSQI